MKCYGNYKVNIAKPPMEVKPKKWFWPIWNCNWCNIIGSRNLSGFAGILSFIIIMIIFFCNVGTENNSVDGIQQEEKLFLWQTNFPIAQSYCLQSNKEIRCSNFNESAMFTVQEEINSIVEGNTDPITLVFIKMQDSVNVMKKNWLQNVTNRIQTMTIQETILPTINENTFEGEPFIGMKKLHLKLTGNLELNSGSFSGLNKLESLIVIGNQIVYANDDTLEAVSSSLSILQLQMCISNPNVIRNLTGGEKKFVLNNLQVLDLQQNEFKTLLNNTFSKTPKVISLYLDYSNLVDGLNVNAFVGIIPEQILMTYTKLTTLPQGIFDPFRGKTAIQLIGNRWNCVCSFQWFQDLCKSANLYGCMGLQCFVNGKIYDLNTFSFCHNNTSTTDKIESTASFTITPTSTTNESTANSTETPTSTKDKSESTAGFTTTAASTTDESENTSNVTITPIPNPFEYQEISCFPANRTIPGSYESLPSRVIYLSSENIRVEFQQVTNEAKYNVKIQDNMEKDIVFILSNKDGWTLCLSEIKNNFILEALEYGETYIVCIMHASQHTVSPKNCQSLSVPKEWKEQNWISNEYKLPIIIVTILGVLLTTALSIMGMYVYVKRNPDIVYGKENVILIQRENCTLKKYNKDLNYDEQRYTPSLMSVSDGYLTPRVYEPTEDSQQIKIPKSISLGSHTEIERDDSNSIVSQNDDIYESVNVWVSPHSKGYEVPSQNIYNNV